MNTPATLLQKYKISVDKEPETPENKQLLASIIENEGKQNLRLLFVMGMLILIVVLSLIRTELSKKSIEDNPHDQRTDQSTCPHARSENWNSNQCADCGYTNIKSIYPLHVKREEGFA